jgi:hypothetical protein
MKRILAPGSSGNGKLLLPAGRSDLPALDFILLQKLMLKKSLLTEKGYVVIKVNMELCKSIFEF